jgi:hypothetical protein
MLLQKLAMPLPALKTTMFCPLSPEAYLLTRTFSIYNVMGSLSKHGGWASARDPSIGSE